MLKTILEVVLKFLGSLFSQIKIAKWETKQREDVSKVERDVRDAIDQIGSSPDADVSNGKVNGRSDNDLFNNDKWVK